jgi:hypothetical protein
MRLVNRSGDHVGDAEGESVEEASRDAAASGWVVVGVSEGDEETTLIVIADR